MKPEAGESVIPFVNLEAMAMMGVGMLYDDLSLFETAYKTFSGKEMTEDMIADLANKVLWYVTVLPRAVKITYEDQDRQLLNRLFEAAA
jgi:hypothetical protein